MKTYFKRLTRAFLMLIVYAVATIILALSTFGASLMWVICAAKEELFDTMSALRSLFIFINQQNKLSWKKS